MTPAERKKHQANCRKLIKALGSPRQLPREEIERRYHEVMARTRKAEKNQ